MNDMNTQGIGSQFIGTPWKNDQEIYDFACERHDVMGWDWTRGKADLINKGLNDSYADAIIENLKVVEKEETGNNNKRKYFVGSFYSVCFYSILDSSPIGFQYATRIWPIHINRYDICGPIIHTEIS